MRFDYDLDAAIFDNDGTLLDTMPYWRYTPLEFMLAHQIPVDPEVLARMYMTSSRKLVRECCEKLGGTVTQEEATAEVEGYMNRHYLYDARFKTPAVPAFLRRLKDGGVKMCVATAAPREYVSNGLRRLGVLELFDFVTDHREFSMSKEQPEYFLKLLERLDADASRTWVFEDALYAVKSAKAAGLRVCAIEEETQARDREEIMRTADIYIKDYTELLNVT